MVLDVTYAHACVIHGIIIISLLMHEKQEQSPKSHSYSTFDSAQCQCMSKNSYSSLLSN